MVEWLVVGSGRLVWFGGLVVFLDRDRVKVFVVEELICGGFGDELGIR